MPEVPDSTMTPAGSTVAGSTVAGAALTAQAPTSSLTRKQIKTARHTSSYLEGGPRDGPLMIFSHGWPESATTWRSSLDYFAVRGWRVVAPDMRGYHGSSIPTRVSDYAMSEIVQDLVELHDSLGGDPAVWVGHDWGSAPTWSMASHHADRVRGVASVTVPYLPRGLTVASLLPLVNREIYPADQYPFGQWDYFLYHREKPEESAALLSIDVRATLNLLFAPEGPEEMTRPSRTASVRANGGYWGPSKTPPRMPRTPNFMTDEDFDELVASFERNGFRGPDCWYLNEELNAAFAATAPNFGRLTMPALLIHATYDPVLDTLQSSMPEPMRAFCSDLTEAMVQSGHFMQVEAPGPMNDAIDAWITAKRLR